MWTKLEALVVLAILVVLVVLGFKMAHRSFSKTEHEARYDERMANMHVTTIEADGHRLLVFMSGQGLAVEHLEAVCPGCER